MFYAISPSKIGVLPASFWLICLTICVIGVGVGVATNPLTASAIVAGVLGLVALMSISDHQPAWILGAVLFGIQVGTVWLPDYKGRHLPISGVDIGIGLLVMTGFARVLARRWSLHRSPIDWWWVFFLCCLFPSLWFTKDLLWWLAGFRQLVEGAVMFYLVYEMIETASQARKLGLLLVAWGTVAAGNLILNVYTSSEGYIHTLVHKETDVAWARSNYFASFMLLVIPVAVFLALYEKKRILRWLLFLAFALMAVSIIITRSTGGAFVGIICVALWPLLIRGQRMRKYLVWLLVIGGVIMGGSFLFSSVAEHTVKELPIIFQDLWQTDKAQDRLMIWRYNLDLFWQSPWIGNGLLSTFMYVPRNRFGSQPQLLEPHNFLIQLLAQTGVIGLLGFVLLWWHAFRSLLKYLRGSAEGTWQRGLLAGILMGVIAALLHGLIEPNILEKDYGIVLWSMIGLAFALGRIEALRKPQSPPARI
jgi:O-antigen ligase